MSKSKIGGVMASAFIAGALVCGSIFASGNQVMTGGSKQGKALWTDYCGMSKEVQGPVDVILFRGIRIRTIPTMSRRAAGLYRTI